MKADAVISNTLVGVLDKLNDLGVKKQDVINVFQNRDGYYVAIFYS